MSIDRRVAEKCVQKTSVSEGGGMQRGRDPLSNLGVLGVNDLVWSLS